MDRQRLAFLIVFAVIFVGMCTLLGARMWDDFNTRFRTGEAVPLRVLPDELLSPGEVIPDGPPQLPELRPEDPLLAGSASSSVTLVVFGDFACPQCREQAQETTEALRLVGSTGSVRVIWRDFPLINQHPRAMAAATVAACAGRQGKFRQMHDALFFEATDLSDTEFLSFASRLRLDTNAFLICLRDPAIPFRLQRDIETARTHAITAVPTLFIDGRPLTGVINASTLATLLTDALTAR
ncbi:MAG: hypothetical protein RL141_615 [Candidatus Parcubacteria bacterium]|jgi:protein-disulfide isomerase